MSDAGLDGLAGRTGWRWTSAPPAADRTADGLRWTCAPATDFWRVTQGHPSKHDGQAALVELAGDFVLEGTFDAPLAVQFDQAGFLVERDAQRWLKAGVELDGRPWLSAVHTREASDWSREPVDGLPLRLRLERRDGTIEVAAELPSGSRTFRVLHLDGPVRVGPYSCAPRGPGFAAELRGLVVRG